MISADERRGMTRTIAWVSGRFDQVGGGERLIQEGLRYYRSQGYRTLVFTWSFNEVVSFDNQYDPAHVIVVSTNSHNGKTARGAFQRLKDLPRLRQLLIAHNVDLIFVQSEYDVALVYLATRWPRIPYRFLIFGQNYQFPEDYGKYTLLFRRHLSTIVNSCAGYRDTTSLKAPKISTPNRVAMEILSAVRLLAVRAAERLYVFSSQVRWETQLLFGRTPTIAKGAFRREELTGPAETDIAARYGLQQRPYILSLCRLAPKKRVNLIIDAFAKAGLADVTLVIGGNGPEWSRLKDQVQRLGISEKVKFLGRVPDDHRRGLKRAAGLFVSMDIGDYDLSPLEALVLKTPIIVPEEFDADDEFRATPGVTICAANADEIADHMKQMLGTRAHPTEALLQNLTWENYFSTLIK
jgi:glycosyltransferase involved in cell wall biosynthesis